MDGVDSSFLAYLRAHYEQQVQRCLDPLNDAGQGLLIEQGMTHQHIRADVLQAERTAVIVLRDKGHIDDEVLRVIEREFDLEEQRL